MKKKFKKKYFNIIIILLAIFFIFGNNVFAQLTDTGSTSTLTNILNTVSNILTTISQFGFTLGTAGLAMILSGIAMILFIVVQMVFAVSGVTNSLFNIPFPDTIVFNTLSLFDANFVNPDSSSPLYSMRTTVASVFDSLTVIAIALFTIIAMIIGIKLALASIASERAKYKQAIGYWISGIVLLVCLKWILAGMFKINESIVAAAYEASKGADMKFDVISIGSIPVIGSTIQFLMDKFGINSNPSMGKVPGYLGLTLKYLLEGFGGNFIGSMVSIVVLGQTITLIGVYLKRVFYCLLLGLLGPLIVAIDTLNRSVGKGSKILGNWLKQLAITIFTQSFHAIFMLVIIRLMVSISSNTSISHYMQSIFIIILTTGLIKFEKVIKQLFGLSDGLMGDLKGGAMKAMATMGAMSRAAGAIGDNGRKLKDAKSRKASLTASKSRLDARRALFDKMGGAASGVNNQKQQFLSEAASAQAKADSLKSQAREKLNIAKSMGNTTDGAKREQKAALLEEAGKLRREAMKQEQIAKDKTASANNTHAGTASSSSSAAGTGRSGASNNGFGGDDEIKTILRSINAQMMEEKSEQINRELAQAESDISSATLAKKMAPANVLAGVAFGMGMDDMAAGAMLTTALDHTAEKVGARGGDAARSRLYDETGDPEVLRKKAVSKEGIMRVVVDTVTQKNTRDIINIVAGKETSSSSHTRDMSEYRYVKDRNNRGHQKIASNVDNV